MILFMKVAHICLLFYPSKGGIEYHVYYLTQELSSMGVETCVITPNNLRSARYEELGKVRVYRFDPIVKFYKLFICPAMLELLIREDFDIYHLHMPFYVGSEFMYVASKIKHRPLIISYHSDTHSFNEILHLFEKVYDGSFARVSLAKSSKIIGTSRSYLHTSPVVKPFLNKTTVIPYGVDPERFHPKNSGENIKDKYGIDEESMVVLFVGSLEKGHYYKGLNYLLEAFADAVRLDNDLILLIVGDGALRPQYELLAKRIGAYDKTIWAGSVNNVDLPDYYAASDMFVLPSVNRLEAFGIVLLEAMACGKPVICTNLAGVRDKVIDHNAGIVVKPKNVRALRDAILKIADNFELCKEFGENGRKAIESTFIHSKIANKVFSVYEEILA